MAGGTSAVPSNDSGTNLGRRKSFRVKEKTLRQVHGELSLDRADVVIDVMWDIPIPSYRAVSFYQDLRCGFHD